MKIKRVKHIGTLEDKEYYLPILVGVQGKTCILTEIEMLDFFNPVNSERGYMSLKFKELKTFKPKENYKDAIQNHNSNTDHYKNYAFDYSISPINGFQNDNSSKNSNNYYERSENNDQIQPSAYNTNALNYKTNFGTINPDLNYTKIVLREKVSKKVIKTLFDGQMYYENKVERKNTSKININSFGVLYQPYFNNTLNQTVWHSDNALKHISKRLKEIEVDKVKVTEDLEVCVLMKKFYEPINDDIVAQIKQFVNYDVPQNVLDSYKPKFDANITWIEVPNS